MACAVKVRLLLPKYLQLVSSSLFSQARQRSRPSTWLVVEQIPDATQEFSMSSFFLHQPCQRPSLRNVSVLSTQDARRVVVAVHEGRLQGLTRRLSKAEQCRIQAGDVYVWLPMKTPDYRGNRLERFTDSRKWGESRIRDGVSPIQCHTL